MLADSRSQVPGQTISPSSGSICATWLPSTPDMRLFPDFDDNLRQAFRQETEMFFESIMREDRSVLDLLSAELHVPERAPREALRHSERLRQPLPPRHVRRRMSVRGGLLRQGSILTVTSYATRTSPVHPRQVDSRQYPRRAAATAAAECAGAEGEHRLGKTSLDARADGGAPRQCRLRRLPQLMDPVGFALENYDAVGRWRTVEEGKPDRCLRRPSRRQQVRRRRRASRRRLLSRPELFVGTLTEKLLTFALGRGVEYYDAPAVRKIVREAQRERLSLLVAHSRNRQEHAVPHEEIAMIITKKLCRAGRSARHRRHAGAAAARRDGSRRDGAGRHAGESGAPARASSTCRWAAHITRWTPPGEGKLDQLSPILSSLAPVKDTSRCITNLELQNAYPGSHATSNSAFLSAAKAK